MDIFMIISLAGGLALFLYGMSMLGSGLEKLSGGRMERTLEKKLKRNFKLALPFYYRNTETGESKVQLLAPLYFPGAPVRLALVLNKVQSDAKEYYEGVTVLPVEWAYMNSRLITKPDEEWAKIVDEIDTTDNDTIQNALDKIE